MVMTKKFIKLGLGLVLAIHVAGSHADVATNIVMLTETPVESFTLPDGSTLKNAYIWKRNSQGLMIIHDDGQHFLNFSNLPDEWKAVYLGRDDEASVGAVSETSTTVVADRYRLKDMLERVPELEDARIGWLLRKDADTESVQASLALALFQSLLSDDRERSSRLVLLIEERGDKIDLVDLKKIFQECRTCSGKGEAEQVCTTCAGSGKCPECSGAGLDKSGLGKSNRACEACGKTGDCPACGGLKTLVGTCQTCRGRGKLLNASYCEACRDYVVRSVNAVAEDRLMKPLTMDASTGIPEILGSLPWLTEDAETFYSSDLNTGGADLQALVACVMYSLLKDEMSEASRYNAMVEVYFPKNKVLKIDDYVQVCKSCKGNGTVETACPACEGQKKKGTCPTCEGSGEARNELTRRMDECEDCEGSGTCAVCGGDGKAMSTCDECAGRGRLFDRLRAEVKLELMVEYLNAYPATVSEPSAE